MWFSLFRKETSISSFSDKSTVIKILSKEIKGPKVGSAENILEGFAKAKNIFKKDLFKKETDKGTFYFIKTFSTMTYTT